MKKIMALVMVIAMILTFVGCSKVEEVTTTSSTLLDYHMDMIEASYQEIMEDIEIIDYYGELYVVIYDDSDENGDRDFIMYECATDKEFAYGTEGSDGEIKAIYEWE